MKLTGRKKVSLAAVIVSWIAGFMAPAVWAINQPLWFCVPITVISVACVPLMIWTLWAMDGGGGEGKGG